MAGRLFRIVLEAPWSGSKDGSLPNTQLRHGTTPSQRVPGFDAEQFDMGRNGANAGLRNTLVQERPGKPIMYPNQGSLVAGDPTLDHVDNVPEDTVKHLFGDWDWPEENLYQDQRMTKGAERERIARMWGNYKREERNRGRNMYVAKIGPPNCPRVACYHMDQRGNQAGLVYRPFDYFGWDTEAYEKPVETSINVTVQNPVTSVSAVDLAKTQLQIEALEARLRELQAAKEPVPVEAPTPKRGPGRPRKNAA